MIHRHVPALDGWRAVSILLVLAAHAGRARDVPGGLGVTIFFFVSGLLITGQILDEHSRRRRVDLGRFYWRRALRLWPASTAFILLAGGAFIAMGGTLPPRAWFGALFDLANYAQLSTHLFDTDIPGLPHPFVILWSLAIEEQFYLVWPVLLALAGAGRRAPLAWVLVGCIVGCLAWRLHLAPLCAQSHGACGPHGDDWIGKSTDTRADSLAFGALAAVLLRSRMSGWLIGALRPGAVGAGAALLLLVTLVVRDDGFRETWRYTLQGLALLVLVTASTLPAHPLGALLSRPALVAIGRLSYGLYLWHWLALMLASRIATSGVGFDAPFVAMTIVLTLTSWFAIERPAIAWRRRAGSNASSGLLPEAVRQPAPLTEAVSVG